MRIGLVGYGDGGRLFHAPYIVAADGAELVGVVTRSPERRRAVAEDIPDVPVYSSLTAMLDAGVEAVTITTPPQTRRELVREAVARGVHVVADKPFAPSAEAGRELVRAAQKAGVLLSVYHNRRWDTDIRSLRQLLDSGRLGRIWRVESHFDLDQPGTLEGGPTGGLLRDLGAHLVDQVLWLFGPARLVYGRLDWIETPEGGTDSAFLVGIDHLTGVHSLLSASKLTTCSPGGCGCTAAPAATCPTAPMFKPRPSLLAGVPSTVQPAGDSSPLTGSVSYTTPRASKGSHPRTVSLVGCPRCNRVPRCDGHLSDGSAYDPMRKHGRKIALKYAARAASAGRAGRF